MQPIESNHLSQQQWKSPEWALPSVDDDVPSCYSYPKRPPPTPPPSCFLRFPALNEVFNAGLSLRCGLATCSLHGSLLQSPLKPPVGPCRPVHGQGGTVPSLMLAYIGACHGCIQSYVHAPFPPASPLHNTAELSLKSAKKIFAYSDPSHLSPQ